MKKILLFSAFCICMLGTSAQISLNTSDLTGVNKIIYNGIDTTVANSMIGFAGASQVWNMTSLTADLKDTLTFLPYSTAPNSTFSSSNLLMKPGSGNTYAYLVNSASSLTFLGTTGMIGTSPVTQISTPEEIILNFPATYNTGFINNYEVNQKFYFGQLGIDSVRQKSVIKKTVTIDAWGNLATPFAGGPYAVLRVKETKISIDTTDGKIGPIWYNAFLIGADSTTTYTWWAKSVGYPLAKATMDSTGNVVQMEWLTGTALVGITEHPAISGVDVYPNPAKDLVTFHVKTPQAVFIRIADIAGRLIDTYEVANNRAVVNSSSFADGMYIYSVISKDNVVLSQGKFSILK